MTPISTIFTSALLPQTALFYNTTPVVTVPGNAPLSAALAAPSNPANPQTPLFAAGFGTPGLINNSCRVTYALDAATDPDGAVPTPSAGVPRAAAPPTQPLRLAFYKNDLRTGWAPNSPTLLCGGDADPTVFFSVNTQTMAAYWAGLPAGAVTVLDVSGTPAGPFAAIQAGFRTTQAAQFAFLQTAAGGGLSPQAAQLQLVQAYHSAVAPFCSLAARSFFRQF